MKRSEDAKYSEEHAIEEAQERSAAPAFRDVLRREQDDIDKGKRPSWPEAREEIRSVWAGEWVARSETELARPCLGVYGAHGPAQEDFAGIQTATRGELSPVRWYAMSNPVDAQERSLQFVDDWLGGDAPKFSLQEIQKAGGKFDAEQYANACAEQRKSFNAEIFVPADIEKRRCMWPDSSQPTYFTGEWVAKSKDELARPCWGYTGEAGPEQRDYGGIQTCTKNVKQPVSWGPEVSNAQDAQEQSFKMLDEWLGNSAPKFRQATMEEIAKSEQLSTKIFAKTSGQHPLKSYEEYRKASSIQRRSVGAKAPSEQAAKRSLSIDRS